MKLTVLTDNNTFIDQYYLGEPAVSYYIQEDGLNVLFDTGYSDVFIRNAKKMGIDLSLIDTLVLSHGHNDHSGGLKYLKEINNHFVLLCHPETFEYKEDENGLFIGSPISFEDVQKNTVLSLSKQSVEISEKLIYLGEIETTFPFEKRYAIGKKIYRGVKSADYIFDDSALAYKGKEGLFIITGCSHAGICNIIEYAKKVCGLNKVHGVIGGFHLFEKGERLTETIEYLKSQNISLLYPCHCVSLEAKIEMGKSLMIHECGVGLQLNVD